ncbi:MAG: prolipoprotein diacylglyceryl transferase [Bacteroidia bacterium]|nr:prolipoprotein diacylglyceryl transferase [Bacteroidia bacterium]
MHLLIIPWDVNPEIFRIGSFAIRWYGLLFASSFLVGYFIMLRIFKNENLTDALLDKLTLYMALGVIIGARLGHCFLYEPEYYLAHPLEILMVWKGGLASHGAAIGIIITVALFALIEWKKFSGTLNLKDFIKTYVWTLDIIAIVVALAGFFIRMGNLMNSEIYGVETTLPWGFVFLQKGETAPKHPTQIYEGLCYLLIFFLFFRLYWRKKGEIYHGLLISLALILIFGSRFFIEFLKEDQVAREAEMILNLGQKYSILPFVIGCLGLVLCLSIKSRHVIRKPAISSKSR